MGILLLPVVCKKELQELHIVSLSLFVAILIFIAIIFLQLCLFGTDTFTDGEQLDFSDMQMPSDDTNIFKVIKSICFMLVAFSFTINLFPIFSALKVKTNENCQKSVAVSIVLVGGLYTFLAITCLFLFGGQIILEKGNIMDNVNKEYQTDKSHWEAFVLRGLFMIVLACHIPFIFFSGKEALLIMIDEISRNKISKSLD